MPDRVDVSAKRLAETDYQNMATILDSLDAVVYVADMQTFELLYINDYGKSIWGESDGKTCWQFLQAGQEGPCSFCTNQYLLDKFGAPTGTYVWEFQNTVNNRWYQCRDQAVPWTDGHLVRLEIATDITERKCVEEELLVAMQRAEELAQKDELTKLYNRRAFFERGRRTFEQSRRFGHPTSLIMMDIDYFKRVNDDYGHSAGDEVLHAVAELMQLLVREIDIVARMGGEEFAFLLPETNLENAAILAERLRSEIERLVVASDVHKISLTASFGVAMCNDNILSIEALLRKADDALYVAKREGRNQMRVAAFKS
jgi:diguanylate cyclase (GGDEF)-like protein